MNGVFNNISVAGIKAVVPSKVIDNMSYADALGVRRCKKQIMLTGVKRRHVSPIGQTSADLAYEAAHQLLKSLEWDPSTIDVLIFATQTPVFCLPSTAFLLQSKLGIKQDSTVFDMNLGCSAATVGIQVVSSLLQSKGPSSRGLLLVSDPVYEIPAYKIQADQLLFGSAGSAVALERTDEKTPLIWFQNKSDGNRYRAIINEWNKPFHMDGEAVFEFGINDVAKDICAFRKLHGFSTEDIDYYVFHQAQSLMLSTMDTSCDIPEEKELRSLEEYGNTNGSSVLVTLCANSEKLKCRESVRILLCAFGVGLSWCSILTELSTAAIYPISISDKIHQ